MPPPPPHVKLSWQMRAMGSTGHMIESAVHKNPGTVLTPAGQILPR